MAQPVYLTPTRDKSGAGGAAKEESLKAPESRAQGKGILSATGPSPFLGYRSLSTRSLQSGLPALLP